MNRRTFLSTLAAIPLVGPVAAMAASATTPMSQVVVEKMSTDSLQFTLPADGRYHWYVFDNGGWMEFVNGKWVPAYDWQIVPG